MHTTRRARRRTLHKRILKKPQRDGGEVGSETVWLRFKFKSHDWHVYFLSKTTRKHTHTHTLALSYSLKHTHTACRYSFSLLCAHSSKNLCFYSSWFPAYSSIFNIFLNLWRGEREKECWCLTHNCCWWFVFVLFVFVHLTVPLLT